MKSRTDFNASDSEVSTSCMGEDSSKTYASNDAGNGKNSERGINSEAVTDAVRRNMRQTQRM